MGKAVLWCRLGRGLQGVAGVGGVAGDEGLKPPAKHRCKRRPRRLAPEVWTVKPRVSSDRCTVVLLLKSIQITYIPDYFACWCLGGKRCFSSGFAYKLMGILASDRKHAHTAVGQLSLSVPVSEITLQNILKLGSLASFPGYFWGTTGAGAGSWPGPHSVRVGLVLPSCETRRVEAHVTHVGAKEVVAEALGTIKQ